MSDFTDSFDLVVNDALMWVNDNATTFFEVMRSSFDGLFKGISWILSVPPFWLVIGLIFVVGWFAVGRLFAIGAALGLWLGELMGLWSEMISTVTLVLSSTAIALIIAIPFGVMLGLSAKAAKLCDVALDFMQTMPAYIYLLPGIALLGYGPTTAMFATCVVAIPPALRLTAHGIRMTPAPLRELGQAVGMTPTRIVFSICIPQALPSIMAGVNQSLMLAFGMVVIAGIVGSGGLGQTVYDAVRMLKIDQAINAGVAIVVLSIVLDRLSQSLNKVHTGGAHE